MAFDYGSIDLGLKNPFKKEGLVTAVRGSIQFLAGVYLLIQAAGHVKEDAGMGWILVVFGVFLLGAGLSALGGGIYATLRYFVGRNHPTSLARNHSKSEASTAHEEAKYVEYTDKGLEEMLVGRKNTTFVEPVGFLARLLHSVLPKLLFMPYPIRNMAQRIFGAWAKTLVALIAFGFVAFVSLAGFAGDAGELIFPIYSALLMVYVSLVWFSAGRDISRGAEKNIESLGGRAFVRVISVAIIMPVVIGAGLSWLMQQGSTSAKQIESIFIALPDLNATTYLICLFIAASLCTAIIGYMLRCRIMQANPLAEVSELRENWQESVHPNEIFINLDNLVMANRRYKEVPNRVYRELDPSLEEQIEGKGAFKGEMIQEIQPKVQPLNLGAAFENTRLTSLIFGNVLHVIAIIFTFTLAYSIVDVYSFFKGVTFAEIKADLDAPQTAELLNLVMIAVHFVLITFMFRSFGKLLSNSAHLFFAEIQFESLLVYFKCEGTFTESKISTGTGIHDSTRSENTLIRSSITPWVIVSRITTTTFAATGMQNLEHPRYILEMHKSEAELQAIRKDVIEFLRNRESIASITSERDLGNASQIHQLNQQTRALNDVVPTERLKQDEEAAGYLRKESDLNEDKAEES
jgi:hypothetical protein